MFFLFMKSVKMAIKIYTPGRCHPKHGNNSNEENLLQQKYTGHRSGNKKEKTPSNCWLNTWQDCSHKVNTKK